MTTEFLKGVFGPPNASLIAIVMQSTSMPVHPQLSLV